MPGRKNIISVTLAFSMMVVIGCGKEDDGGIYQRGSRERPKSVSDLVTEHNAVKYSYAIIRGEGKDTAVARVIEVEIEPARWQKFWNCLVWSEVHSGFHSAGPGVELIADRTLPMTPAANRSILTQKTDDGTVTMAMYPDGYIVYQNSNGNRNLYRGPDLYSIFHLLHTSELTLPNVKNRE